MNSIDSLSFIPEERLFSYRFSFQGSKEIRIRYLLSQFNQARRRSIRMNFIKIFLRIEDTENRFNILIRILAGGVFLWEGIIKFLFVNQGAGRFAKLGFANPELVAGGIGAIEIIGGISLILGFATKQWSIVFIIEMLVAMTLTKIPLYLGTSPLAPPPSPPVIGIWAVLHEIRSEFSQLLSCIYLLCAGPGRFSLDDFRKARERNV